MEVSIVILSYAKSTKHLMLTRHAIRSLRDSEKDIKFNIVVVEQKKDVKWTGHGVETLHINEEFNYNRFSNKGIEHALSIKDTEWIGVFNNDVIFHKGWCSELIKREYLSMSPKCSNTLTTANKTKDEEGYIVGKQVLGWSLFFKQEVWKTIEGFDECVNFWFSDDCYSQQIFNKGIRHCLIVSSLVDHQGHSNTLMDMDSNTIDSYTKEQTKIFNLKYKRNKFNMNPEYELNEQMFLNQKLN